MAEKVSQIQQASLPSKNIDNTFCDAGKVSTLLAIPILLF
jgi:hypothetical protein